MSNNISMLKQKLQQVIFSLEKLSLTTKILLDNKLDGYADVINYINRLEHDVAIAKKQLKNQRQNFRKAISA